MDELKIIFWIVVGLIYLFTRRKKRPETKVPTNIPEQSADDYGPPGPVKQLTFEELLDEIQGKKKEAPITTDPYNRPPVKRTSEKENYGDELVHERKQLEDTDYDYRSHDKIYDVYEDAKKQAFFRPSLEETVKLEDIIVRFKQFKSYETTSKRSLAEEYFKELKEPQGFKKAFIMSEILKRRF